MVLLGLGGWALFHWLRFGRDPVYVDSASVLVPAPPDGMTAATATLVFDGQTSRRSLTTALLDLASRGKLAFRETEWIRWGSAARSSPSTSGREPRPRRSTTRSAQVVDARRLRPVATALPRPRRHKTWPWLARGSRWPTAARRPRPRPTS